jgi:hypothetical protein
MALSSVARFYLVSRIMITIGVHIQESFVIRYSVTGESVVT